ncbi:MAG: hypothetical protein WBG58_14365 [Ignavibacteriaceae bacterium]
MEINKQMDWQGIEWVLLLTWLSMIVVPIYTFITLLLRVKRGVEEKPRAIRYYAGVVISPIIFYGLFFFGLVGLKEFTQIDLVTEGLARSFIIVIGIGLIIWLVSLIIFSITIAFLRRPG